MGRDALGRFKAGESSCLTQEEKLRLAESLSKAWRSNPNYIGDLVEKHPRIYNSWRSIRFTQKGKLAGCSDEWRNFKAFYNDVVGAYRDGTVLRRKDTLAPWSKDNFMWVESSFSGDLTARIFIEYEGRSQTIKQWGEELGIPYNHIKLRYYKHKDDWSVKDILFGKKKQRNAKQAKDISDPSVIVRSKASKMIRSYRNTDIKNGAEPIDFDIDWMVENILTKPCVYCGDTQRIGCDRIDNSKGHTKDNVVPCCIECNTARNNYFTYDEMRKIGRAIAEVKAARGERAQGKTEEEIQRDLAHDKEYRRHRCMKKVFQYTINDEFVAEYESENEAASLNNVSANSINAAVNGKARNGHKLINYLWYNERTIKNK